MRNKISYREHSSLQCEPLITNKLSRRKPTTSTFLLERISKPVYIKLKLQQFRRTHSLCLYSQKHPKLAKQLITEHGLPLFFFTGHTVLFRTHSSLHRTHSSIHRTNERFLLLLFSFSYGNR